MTRDESLESIAMSLYELRDLLKRISALLDDALNARSTRTVKLVCLIQAGPRGVATFLIRPKDVYTFKNEHGGVLVLPDGSEIYSHSNDLVGDEFAIRPTLLPVGAELEEWDVYLARVRIRDANDCDTWEWSNWRRIGTVPERSRGKPFSEIAP